MCLWLCVLGILKFREVSKCYLTKHSIIGSVGGQWKQVFTSIQGGGPQEIDGYEKDHCSINLKHR